MRITDYEDTRGETAGVKDKEKTKEQLIDELVEMRQRLAELKVAEAKRKEAEEALIRITGKLEQSNRELQDFTYISSHHMQEPLRKIQAFGYRLRMKFDDTLDDKGRDYLERMQNAAARMQTLINDLLAYSWITTRACPFVPTDLTQSAREAELDLEVRIERTGGQVEIDELPTIDADSEQMRQLLRNLMSNALKFHRPNVRPVVKVFADQKSNACCQINVKDNGIGFDEKYLARIFTPFQRLHNRVEFEGTGMGLAICRKIAERHDGIITAKSTPGQGTTVTVTLPVKQPKGKSHHEN